MALNPGGPITRDLFPDSLGAGGASSPAERSAPFAIPPEGFDLEAWIQALKGYFLKQALDEVGGVKTKAGKRLGMTFRAYRYWMAELGGLEALATDFPWPESFPPAPEDDGGTEGEKDA